MKPLNTKISKFFSRFPQKKYSKGEFLIQPDTLPAGIFYLKEGLIWCYSLSKEGVELTINIFKPRSIFPLLYVFNNKPDRYYYQLLTDSVVSCIPKESVYNFIHKEPSFALNLLKRIYKGLDGYFLRMEALLSADAYLKTITHIYLNTLRFGEEKANKRILLNSTQNHIASQSGVTRETVTRVIKKLQKQGIVGYENNHLIIYNLPKLEKEVIGLE